MRLSYLRTALAMSTRELARNRIAVLLLFVVPTVFFALVALTTTNRTVSFRLATVSRDALVEVSERSESLIFVAAAAVGLLAAFVALGMVQKHSETNRRLVICGYRPAELIVARLAVLLGVALLIGLFVTTQLRFFFRPERFLLLVLGLALAGFVYGCYGLLVGSIFRRELEGILFISLLANIDAGWLQNPVFYAGAQHQFIIRVLPAYYPCQASMVSAFTQHSLILPVLGSLGYGTLLLAAAMTAYFLRMRTRH